MSAPKGTMKFPSTENGIVDDNMDVNSTPNTKHIRTTPSPPPLPTTNSPSRKVTLKLRVRNDDLTNRNLRSNPPSALTSNPSRVLPDPTPKAIPRPKSTRSVKSTKSTTSTPSTSKPNSKSKPKSKSKLKFTPAHQRKRPKKPPPPPPPTPATVPGISRPRGIYISDEEEEQEDEHGDRVEKSAFDPPSFENFHALSALTFPVLVKDGLPLRQRRGLGQTRMREEDRGSVRPRPVLAAVGSEGPQRCVGCGVPALEVTEKNRGHCSHQGQHENQCCGSGAMAPPPLPPARLPSTLQRRTPTSLTDHNATIPHHPTQPLRPPWEMLNLHPTRHTNPETSSETELVVTRSGPIPHTAEFWYDMTIGEMAARTEDLDFKILCLNLMRWRRENDVVAAAGVVRLVEEGGGGVEGHSGRTDWDHVVRSAVEKGKMWRKVRRRRDGECGKAAGWAVWEGRQRRGSRGEFVEDGVGAWVLRGPGEEGAVRRVLKLGYKRHGRSSVSRGSEDRSLAITGTIGDDMVALPGRDCDAMDWSMCEEAVEKAIVDDSAIEEQGKDVADAMDIDEVFVEEDNNAVRSKS